MSEGLEWVCLQPVADAITDDLEELRWEALTRGTIHNHYGKSREGAKYKHFGGLDPTGNPIDVTVMRHEDGTLYHEGKDYEVKDGVITALPGGRIWGGKHETVHVSYTLQPAKKQPPLHKPQPWNPPVAKRRKR